MHWASKAAIRPAPGAGFASSRYVSNVPPTKPLKILLADADPGRAAMVERSLAGDRGATVIRLAPDQPLIEAVRTAAPDVIIVDMARPDRDALDSVRAVAAQEPRPIVLFVDEDDPAFMQAAVAAGVSSYNVVGTALPDVKPIVRAAVAIFERHRQLEVELQRAEASLAARRLVDQAKALLMKRRKMSEPQAYRWLQRRAMNTGRRLVEIASEVVHDRSE